MDEEIEGEEAVAVDVPAIKPLDGLPRAVETRRLVSQESLGDVQIKTGEESAEGEVLEEHKVDEGAEDGQGRNIGFHANIETKGRTDQETSLNNHKTGVIPGPMILDLLAIRSQLVDSTRQRAQEHELSECVLEFQTGKPQKSTQKRRTRNP